MECMHIIPELFVTILNCTLFPLSECLYPCIHSSIHSSCHSLFSCPFLSFSLWCYSHNVLCPLKKITNWYLSWEPTHVEMKEGEQPLSHFFLRKKRWQHDPSKPIRMLHPSGHSVYFKDVCMVLAGLITVCSKNVCHIYRKIVSFH